LLKSVTAIAETDQGVARIQQSYWKDPHEQMFIPPIAAVEQQDQWSGCNQAPIEKTLPRNYFKGRMAMGRGEIAPGKSSSLQSRQSTKRIKCKGCKGEAIGKGFPESF
jgi:hypothetical protein